MHPLTGVSCPQAPLRPRRDRPTGSRSRSPCSCGRNARMRRRWDTPFSSSHTTNSHPFVIVSSDVTLNYFIIWSRCTFSVKDLKSAFVPPGQRAILITPCLVLLVVLCVGYVLVRGDSIRGRIRRGRGRERKCKLVLSGLHWYCWEHWLLAVLSRIDRC